MTTADLHPAVAGLTLAEKAGLLSGASFWATRPVEHAGIEAMVLTDGPHGVRLQHGDPDHLGLGGSRPATCFPTAAATGSTWDPDLLRSMGVALAAEARALGVDVLLGPGVNIKRHPLCGRNFEYFSEDPLLAGVLGAAWVEGLQSGGVGASVKHFAANNQETDRMRVSAEVDERTLREIYLPAFERILREARPATVMCSYNRLNGTYAAEHPWLLTEVLREDWGFDGFVVSDWGAVADPAASVRAGLDLEMPSTGDRAPAAILAAVEAGELSEAEIDRAVSRILTVQDRLDASRAPAANVDPDAHHDLARRIAVESCVLLTNDGVLPLGPDSGGPIAVLGELARTPRYQGAGSSKVNPTRIDDALGALRAATGREVRFAAGYRLDDEPAEDLVAEALEVAGGAAVTVLFLGLPDSYESEGFDRTSMELPAVQLALLDAILTVTDRVVLVLSNGAVVDLSEVAGRVPAVLETWLAGQAGGSAIADVLLGAAEPGGRLAETVPLRLSDTPAYVNWPGDHGTVRYGERIYVGYRWYDRTEREVCFPFGHGLGYTTWAYADLVVDVPDPTVAAATVEVTVTNTGDRAGAEVVQVYVGDVEASVDRPVRELCGFAKVRLDAGESTRVRIELDERAFAFWGPDGWVVEPGGFDVEVGASSRDVRARTTLTLDVPVAPDRLGPGATLAEWAAHPVGEQVLREALGPGLDEAGYPLEQVLELGGTLPLVKLLSFQPGIDAEAMERDLLAAVGVP